ncbi:MAG: 2,4'-dihydroxyacetophenone dioxygenase family protein [Afipia sp.]|nr:2,4'-dihydroxyacetophenone dioxygenase family protein [Afipia sp.]
MTVIQPWGIVPDIAVRAIPEDDRLWVPETGKENVWFRPLMLDTVSGSWAILLRMMRAGIYSRHRHPGQVHAYVIKGAWRYLEHDWTATPGTYVFEPPGETHTLVVDSADEMITFFHNVSGVVVYVDDEGCATGHEDVFTRIEMCRRHFRSTGLGEDLVMQFMR